MPQNYTNQAMAHYRKGNIKSAIGLYQKALEINPNFVQAWTNLGVALRRAKHFQSAINCHLRAHHLRPNDGLILNNLANACKDANQLLKAIHYAELACQLEPKNSSFHFNHAIVLREAKQFNEAIKLLEKCKLLDPEQCAKYDWDLAQCYLYLENMPAGWDLYKARFANGMLPNRNFSCKEWQGEELENKNIYIVAEQGFGDTIFAARYLPVMAEWGAQITLECRQPLFKLFESLPIARFITPDEQNNSLNNVDFYVYIMSIPGIFERLALPHPAPVPISVPTKEEAPFVLNKRELASQLRVGIVWSGSETFADNARRSPGLLPFLSLAAIPHVQLYSLQKGAREKDLDDYFARSYIIDLAPHLHDFAATASIIAQLDIIVMSDSSVAHLSASLGKPVLNLLHSNPYWLYGTREETTHWYPSMRLIRQKEPNNWQAVFVEVEQVLTAMTSVNKC